MAEIPLYERTARKGRRGVYFTYHQSEKIGSETGPYKALTLHSVALTALEEQGLREQLAEFDGDPVALIIANPELLRFPSAPEDGQTEREK